jgi:hypothetical protein
MASKHPPRYPEISPAVAEYLFARYSRSLDDAEHLVRNRMRETTSLGPGRKRIKFLPNTAISRAATPEARAKLERQYDAIGAAAVALLDAEIERRRHERPATIKRAVVALKRLDKAGQGIPEHFAVALFAWVQEARAALSAADIERLAVVDDFVDRQAFQYRVRGAQRFSEFYTRRKQGLKTVAKRRREKDHHRAEWQRLLQEKPGAFKDWAAERIADDCNSAGRSCTVATIRDHLKTA